MNEVDLLRKFGCLIDGMALSRLQNMTLHINGKNSIVDVIRDAYFNISNNNKTGVL